MPTIIEIKLIIVILIQKLYFFMLFLLKLESIQVICWWESKPGKVWIIIHGRKGQGMPGHHRKSSGQWNEQEELNALYLIETIL